MIRAITFDLDGVYFLNGKSNFITNLVKLGVSKEMATNVFLKSEEMNRFYKTGKMSDREYWQFAINKWGLSLSVGEIVNLLIKGYEINSEIVNVVKGVRKKGFKTCICSNNFPARINGLQKKYSFLDDFDAISLSYQVGATKPSVKIFQDLVDRAKVKPEEIIFADDNDDNLLGAKKLGIQAFFYEGVEKFFDRLKTLGVSW
tara:strand:- start:143 stop:748 length:606 start_codon:yes stop_codon:yes gene_type:complete